MVLLSRLPAARLGLRGLTATAHPLVRFADRVCRDGEDVFVRLAVGGKVVQLQRALVLQEEGSRQRDEVQGRQATSRGV